MSSVEKNFLTLEEVCDLLPDSMKFNPSKRIERSVYETKEGKPLPIINSRLYPQNFYWYSCVTSHFKAIGAESICFTAGNYGILIIPIDVVLHYNKFSGWKREGGKGRQYHVRIRHTKDNELSFWNFNEPSENINITQYLIKHE